MKNLFSLVVLSVALSVAVLFFGGCSNNDNNSHDAHTEHSFGNWVVTKVATCEVGGEETSVCSFCGQKITQPIATMGHKFSDSNWTTTKPVVCGGEAGEETRICIREGCKESETRIISAINHIWSDLQVTIPATCTEVGEKAKVCSLCHEKKDEQEISALGHILGNWTVTTAPVCDEDGEETRICTREDCDHSEKRVVLTNCFTISTEAELIAFRDEVNGGKNFEGVIITLKQNIQLTNRWIPIGKYVSSSSIENRLFSGTFDGNNKTISGLEIGGGAGDYQGFFAYLSSTSVVKDLNIVDIDILAGGYIGGLAGRSAGVIKKCHVSGNLVATGTAGLLVGFNIGRVENSHTVGHVTGNTVGGLVGGLHGINYSNPALITNCYANVNVNGSNAAGGLVGDVSFSRIENNYALGDVTVNGSFSYAGGLVGRIDLSDLNIINCYAIGIITGNYSGGIIGRVGLGSASTTVVTSSYYDSETTGLSSSIGRTTVEMKQQNTYENWNFNTVWGIDPTINDGYPYLRVFQ